MDRNYAVVFLHIKRSEGLTKEDVAHKYSGGRTTSLKDLTDAEYLRMVRELSRRKPQDLRPMRSKALRLLQIYGVDTLNWDRINEFVSQKKIAGKVFSQLNREELEALVRKMRSIIYKAQVEKHKHLDNFSKEKGSVEKPTTPRYTLEGTC